MVHLHVSKFKNSCTEGQSISRNILTIIDGVLDSPEPIMGSVLDLSQSVLVRPLDHDGHRLGVLALLNEGVLLLSLFMKSRLTGKTMVNLLTLTTRVALGCLLRGGKMPQRGMCEWDTF